MKTKSVRMRFYEVFPGLTEICNAAGYSLAVHGSMARDIDLIAAPWSAEAIEPRQLVDRIIAAHGPETEEFPWHVRDKFGRPIGTDAPEKKPHGRLAWSIYVADRIYLDLSIMPRRVEA